MSKDIPEWMSNLSLDIYKIIRRYKAISRFMEMLNIWAEDHEAEIANVITWNEQRASHFEKIVSNDDRLRNEKAGPPEDNWQFQGHVQHTDDGHNLIQGWVPPKLATRPDVKRILPLSGDHELSLPEKYTVFAVIYEYGRKGTEQLPLWEWPDFTKQQTPEAMSNAKKCLSFECLNHSVADLAPEDEGWLRIMLKDVEADVAEWAGVQSTVLKKKTTTAVGETRTDRVIRLVKDNRLITILILFGVLVIAVGTVVEKFDSIITFWHRITGQKLEVSTEDDLVLSMGRTPMYARTRKKVDELEHMLINDKLMPWRLLPTGKPIEVTDYYGKTLHFEGVMFSGSPRTVFWGSFIEPFIENGIIEVLDATAEDCRANNLEPKPYLEEAANLLEFMISTVYGFMAETDLRLLGRSRQERKDVSDKIAMMNQLLEEHKAAALLLFSESDRFNARSRTIVSRSKTSIEPEQEEGDVNRSGPPPILKIAESSIAPEETTAEVNQPEPKPIIKKDEPSIKPEDTEGKVKK